MKKVVVGMSGGVDSSVTAYLLKEQGYEVKGISFILYEARLRKTFAKAPCCSIESVRDAGETAGLLGIEHTSVDLRDAFLEKVIEPFIAAYEEGITPNPCILCNKHIKFPFLMDIAEESGADCIATGHYARVINGKLLKGSDLRKDQSYVLYVLHEKELRNLLLPLGKKKKDEVREIARSLQLPAAERPESQEICFIEETGYFRFLDRVTGRREGLIIDVETNKVLGTHKGIHLYTVGQRKRLVATGKPIYVVRIDTSENIVYVGPRERAIMKDFEVHEVNWLTSPPMPSPERGDRISGPPLLRATVKVRSTMKDEPAALMILSEERVKVVYDVPQWAPAPGQSAVFYDTDRVIGGGVIVRK